LARPKKPVDGRLVRQLAALMCSAKDIATAVGCSVDTLERRFSDETAKGRAEGRTTLRRRQWEAAMSGNAALLIFLGKNLLGQTDRTDITSGREPIAAPVRQYEMPDNGRGPRQPGPAADALPITPPRSLRMPTRPSAAPPNGDGLPGYPWSDGTRRSLPEDGG
jgi:hypothetical protein